MHRDIPGNVLKVHWPVVRKVDSVVHRIMIFLPVVTEKLLGPVVRSPFSSNGG